ncbi:MAG: hypothetical protein ACK55I_48115, partial [bacterium]
MRRINTITGVISTVIGGTGVCVSDGDSEVIGSASLASVNAPAGLYGDSNRILYIVENVGNRIRKLDLKYENVTTINSVTLGNLPLAGPTFITGDIEHIYVSDTSNHMIKRIHKITNVVDIYVGIGAAGFTGDFGPATSARLNQPRGIQMHSSGVLY